MNLNKQYSSALLSLANESNSVKPMYKSTTSIIETFENKDLVEFMKSLSIETEEKHKMLERIFKKKVDTVSMNTMKLMADKGHGKYIGDVFKKFRQALNNQNGVEEGIVYSSAKLAAKNVKLLEKKIGEKLSKEVELANLVDKQLISGIKVEIADEVFDYSAKGTLSQIKEKLLKETI